MSLHTANHIDHREILSNPQVLWAAWLRVDAWYRSAELAPQPELSVWKLHPEAELRKLADLLQNGEWKPVSWPLLPYPKKGQIIRHYCMPTVRDQVAFMAYLVLLGPLLDAKMKNFSFGNRWYRPLMWDRRKNSPRWELLPYPFLGRRTYLPYSRSHGLYRRVASWTVSRMVDAPIERTDHSGPVQVPDDYRREMLPDWVRPEWWGTSKRVLNRAHWAALDLQLAFPSVKLCKLSHALSDILSEDGDPISDILSGFPYTVVDALNEELMCKQLAHGLIEGLKEVRYSSGPIQKRHWQPPHAPQELPPDNPGLPTGLAISPLLLNVVLHPADRQLQIYLKGLEKGQRGAILRFADDMTILSQSAKGLLTLIDEVWRAIASDNHAVLAVQKSDSNLFLNAKKIAPEGVQKVFVKYLNFHGWKECKDCEVMVPETPQDKFNPIAEWWNKLQKDQGRPEFTECQDHLNRETVGRYEMGPFVTTLVERLSTIGRDTLVERFGQGARDRLVFLHDLAKLNIDDQQVRPDTRRAFAVNRLVAAWLPVDQELARKDIKEIRESVEFVLQETPWKAALWRAVIRAAALRPESPENADEQDARKWLLRMLGRIVSPLANSSKDDFRPECWDRTWPKADTAKHHERDESWRSLYLSYHRATFWNTLANAILDLRRNHERLANPSIGRAGPSPRWWAVRAIPEGEHAKVADFLADLDRWRDILYLRDFLDSDLQEWSWELSQAVCAVLAATDQADLATARRHCENGEKRLLQIPAEAIPPEVSKTMKLLHRCGRLLNNISECHDLDSHELAHIRLARKNNRLAEILFPAGSRPIICENQGEPTALIAGLALGCSASIPTKWASDIVSGSNSVSEHISKNWFDLNEYGRVRRVLMGRPDGLRSWASSAPTIHRLLWGLDPSRGTLEGWIPKPWEIPELGLTVVLALHLFNSVQFSKQNDEWDPKTGPFTWELREEPEGLAQARQLQFGQAAPMFNSRRIFPKAIQSKGWEIPPHPAFFLPFVAGSTEVNGKAYVLYCNVLLLLTALDGGERVLHGLAQGGVGSVPLKDRWSWRSRIHLPVELWECIEEVLRWADSPHRVLCGIAEKMQCAVKQLLRDELAFEDLFQERIDIRLDPHADVEIIRTVRPRESADESPPQGLLLNIDSLDSQMVVRICQVDEWPEKDQILRSFPVMDYRTSSRIMQQVASAFMSRSSTVYKLRPDLIVLPEVTVPEYEVQTIRELVESEECACLTGLYWRELRPAYAAAPTFRATRRWFVNEAELIIPIGADKPGPTGSRWFRVRKPVPAHVEMGLSRALTSISTDQIPATQWSMLRGQRWYRFLHPNWGDFSVAICADLLDAGPWRMLRGEILHLFMVAWNKSVDLYEALTWVRAYETYVNIVAVNHGKYGGSFLWTPRRGFERELARFRGNELFMLVDVKISVKEFANAQREGVRLAVAAEECGWLKCGKNHTKFKAPPPGYERKYLL